MLSLKTRSAILITFLSLGFPGCSGIPAGHTIHSVFSPQKKPLDIHEKAQTYFCTGYFFMLDKNFEKAADNFEKASQLDHTSERTLRHLATCYFQLGKNEKSISIVEKLAGIKPHDFSVHYTLATLYETVGKRSEAIAEYEMACQCTTTKLDHVFLTDALYRLANLYMDEGMTEKGVACYKSMFDMKLVSDPAKVYFEIGQRYFEKNDMKNALEYFLKVKAIDPNLNSTGFYLTLCYDALNDHHNAIREAKAFLEKDPDNWVMHLALSEIYGKLKNDTQRNEEICRVQDILEKNMDTGSKNPKEYFLLCQMYRNQHRIGDAITVMENAKLIPMDNNTKRDTHFLLANLYYDNQHFDKVEEELKITLKIDPDFHEANNFLGYFFAERNINLDEAINLINKALKAQPQNGAYLDSLGWAYYKKAQVEGRDDYLVPALQKLLEAVQYMKEPDIYEHLGDVHYSLGHWSEAVSDWEKAQALYKQKAVHETQLINIVSKLEKVKKLILSEKSNTGIIANCVEIGNNTKP